MGRQFFRMLGAGMLAAGLLAGYAPGAAGAEPGAAAGSGGWGKAVTLGGGAGAPSLMSCSSPGSCTAAGQLGGYVYTVRQVRGACGKPAVIRGTARTSRPSSSPGGLACFRAGGCVLAGTYRDSFGHSQAFIVTRSRGTWGKLTVVPGLARLDRGNSAGISYLSCPSAGNCTAAGSYTDAKRGGHEFTVSQARGRWGHAVPVPGVTGLPGQAPGTIAGFQAISCPAPGTCAAGGSYQVGAGPNPGGQAYVVDEVHGTWGTPQPVPGLAALNTGLYAVLDVISCPSPGNCAAGGGYTEANGVTVPFVVNETHGTWGTATEVNSSISDWPGDGAWVTAMSCPSAGNCLAGGLYQVFVDGHASKVFVVSEVNGTWGQAIPVPGTSRLNQGFDAWVTQISCSSAGNCGVAGWYSATDDRDLALFFRQPFVATEVHGTWRWAIEVPGIKTPPPSIGSFAATTTIACPAPGRCSAGGYYQDAKGRYHTFVVSQP